MSIEDFFDSLFRYIRQQSRGISIQELLITWLIGIVFVHLVLFIFLRITGKKYSWKKSLWWILVVGYFCFGSQITLLRRQAGSRDIMYTTLNFGSLTGDYFSRQQFFYSMLNVFFFVPWGILWGISRWNDIVIRRIFMVTCYCFLTSFAIELTQLLTGRGFFELGDFVTNVAGGMIGSIIASIYISVVDIRRKETGRG